MHILAFILIFVVGSIIAACDGDYSGIAATGKFVGFLVLLFAVLWLFTQPVLLIIAIVVLVLIVICSSSKQRWFYDSDEIRNRSKHSFNASDENVFLIACAIPHCVNTSIDEYMVCIGKSEQGKRVLALDCILINILCLQILLRKRNSIWVKIYLKMNYWLQYFGRCKDNMEQNINSICKVCLWDTLVFIIRIR